MNGFRIWSVIWLYLLLFWKCCREKSIKIYSVFCGACAYPALVTPILKGDRNGTNFWEIYNNREYEQEKREADGKDNYFENIDIIDFLPEDWENGEEMETDSGTMER